MELEELVHANQKKLYTIREYSKMENEDLERRVYQGEIIALYGVSN